tara:strand:- start:1083 stop:2249 length:1167 start_codon:yes stop_codon:yes gene_type:complete
MGVWEGIFKGMESYEDTKIRKSQLGLQEKKMELLEKEYETNTQLKRMDSFFSPFKESSTFNRSNTKLNSVNNKQSQVYKAQLLEWGLKPEHLAHIDSYNDPAAIANTWDLADTARKNLAKIHGQFKNIPEDEINTLYVERLNNIVSSAVGQKGQDVQEYNNSIISLARDADIDTNDSIFTSRLNRLSNIASQGTVSLDESLSIFEKPKEEKDITRDVLAVIKDQDETVNRVYTKHVKDLNDFNSALTLTQEDGFYKYLKRDGNIKQLNEQEVMQIKNQLPIVLDFLERMKDNKEQKNSLLGQSFLENYPKNYQTNKLLLASLYGQKRDKKVYLNLVPSDWQEGIKYNNNPNLLFNFLYSKKLLPSGIRVSRINNNNNKVTSIISYTQD